LITEVVRNIKISVTLCCTVICDKLIFSKTLFLSGHNSEAAINKHFFTNSLSVKDFPVLYSKDSGIEAKFVKVRFPEKSVEM
jgi:hypothetical protein